MSRPARLTAGYFRVRMSSQDEKRLLWLVKHYETTASDVLRQLVRGDYDRLREGKKISPPADPERKVNEDGSA